MSTPNYETQPPTNDPASAQPDLTPGLIVENPVDDVISESSKCIVQRPSERYESERKVAAFAKSTGSDQPRKSAVFVAHGMGQQLRYSTLDQIAQKLLEKDARQRGGEGKQPPTETITLKGEHGLMWGIKLMLQNEDQTEREVHIFEGYWAPLTEGEVTLRDVITFLFIAGLNGLKNGRARFNRWLFGRYSHFRPNLAVIFSLVVAVAGIASLVVMNTALVTVAAVDTPLTNKPPWIGGLKADLTTTFNIFILFALLLGLAIAFSSRAREKRRTLKSRKILTGISQALFGLTLAALIFCGIAIALLFYGHVFGGAKDLRFWELAFGADAITAMNSAISLFIIAIVLIALVVALFTKKNKGTRSVLRFKLKWSRLPIWIGIVAVCGIVAAVLVYLGRAILSSRQATAPVSWDSVMIWINGISWPLLIAVSWMVRRLLVQYVGDVAVYITPHTLDRFNSLREKIREKVVGAAKTVYATRRPDKTFEYEDVFIVGHSLGSVIVYDTLNWLINEDEFHQSTNKLEVAGRTRLLLTFGSPLDKIAFLFALQKEKTSEEREALTGAAQPLIQHPEFRQFDWINIYSPNDIISGELNFYDPLGPRKQQMNIKKVENERDTQATTFLAAHVEYWENPLLFKILHKKLTTS